MKLRKVKENYNVSFYFLICLNFALPPKCMSLNITNKWLRNIYLQLEVPSRTMVLRLDKIRRNKSKYFLINIYCLSSSCYKSKNQMSWEWYEYFFDKPFLQNSFQSKSGNVLINCTSMCIINEKVNALRKWCSTFTECYLSCTNWTTINIVMISGYNI